jgi:hypothetical protein
LAAAFSVGAARLLRRQLMAACSAVSEKCLSEHAPSSPSPYDLSEAALRGLYLDRDDEDEEVAKLLAKTERPIAGRPEEQPAGVADAALRLAPAVGPARREPRESTDGLIKPAKTKPRGKILGAVLAVFGLLLVFGWATSRHTQTPVVADAAKRPSAIAGALRVADLAAGRKINPGEIYGIDLPAGKVRIAVVAGEVALMSRSGESLRPCSSQPFVVDASSGSDNLAHPLVSACGHEASFIRAEIPPPPLPSPAPLDAITSSTIRASGD